LIIRLIVIFMFFTASFTCAALPPVVFNSISSINGLPQNSGRVLLQDNEGFIWIGTEDGLVRFDGGAMLSFRKSYDDLHTLSDNYIGSLVEDSAGRVWVGTMGGGLNIIDKRRESVLRMETLASSDILDLTYDAHSEKLLIATRNGLYQLDTAAELLQQPFDALPSPIKLPIVQLPVQLPDGTPFQDIIAGIVIDGDDVWIATRGSGVLRYNQSTENTIAYQKGENGLEDDTFNTIFRDRDGKIWLGGQNKGLAEIIDRDAAIAFRHYNTENSELPVNDVMTLADADDGKLWAGTWNGGLALFDKKNETVDSYDYQFDDQFSLPSNIILDILRNRNGQIWIGTFDKGVSWFQPKSPFHTYRKNPLIEDSLAGNIIWSFAAEGENMLWVGTSKGLSKLDLQSNRYITPDNVQPGELWEKVRNDDIRALFQDGSDLWIAAKRHGVCRLSLDDAVITPLSQLVGSDQQLTDEYVRLIKKDSRGILWLAAVKGLNRVDLKNGRVRQYLADDDGISLPHNRIRALYEDNSSRMWIGTTYGALLLDSEGNPVEAYQSAGSGISSSILAGNGVRGINEDHTGRFWFATEGGISIYDPLKNETTVLREKDGLPGNACYCVIPDRGYMWVSTLNGLARIDTQSLHIESYTTVDGLPNNEFNFNAWHKLPDGRIALGTLSGFTLFRPEMVPGPEKSADTPPLYLQAYNYIDDVRSPLHLQSDEKITLQWENNKISFGYSALDYQKQDAVVYEYKLSGVSDVWSETDNPRFITFNGLSAGDYTFSLRARDKHGVWIAESVPVQFTVAQVPWKTSAAYLGYLVLICSALTAVFFLYNRRLHQRSVQLEKIVADRTAELETSNSRLKEKHQQLDQLLTSRERLIRAVAHEVRTPLTVILSSAESLIEDDQRMNPVLQLIYNRARKMKDLIDNLLDLANRSGGTKLNKSPFLIKPAIGEAISPFRHQFQQEEKVLQEQIDIERECLYMSREVFIMVISNLLSNGCKYTDQGGRAAITCSCDGDQLTICVEDDGVGVPKGAEESIFDWFVRADTAGGKEGWGIGLAFVKDEVEAAGGTITFSREGRKGAKFVVALPLAAVSENDRLSLEKQFAGAGRQEMMPRFSRLEKTYTMLIIEDDDDLRSHLTTLFPESWKKLTAADAENGITMAMQHEPDIIITDLMLPGESGFDLTRKLKDDPQTCHIPIIILTALENEENRLTGLGLSADSFIGKPFNNRELQLRVDTLLANRERMLAYVMQSIFNTPYSDVGRGNDQLHKVEKDFLATLDEKLGENQAVSKMSLEDAAVKMAMSKRSLQREMESIGISWREYKRLRRIKFAMELLADKERQIGDVAEMTGYSSAAHFSKIFKEIIGESPTEWRNHLQ